MKQVTVVCIPCDRQTTIEVLGDLGILHVRDVKEPESAELTDLCRRRDRIDRACNILSSRRPPAETAGRPAVTDTDELVEATLTAATELQQHQETLVRSGKALEALRPWGSFAKTDLAALEEHGLKLILTSCKVGTRPEVPDGCTVQEVSTIKGTAYFAVVVPADAVVSLPRIPVPELTDEGELRQRIVQSEQMIGEIEKRLEQFAAGMTMLRQQRQTLEETIAFVSAREGMGTTENLCFLQGYVPETSLSLLHQAAQEHGWAVLIRDPEEDDRNVPTKITLPRWVEPIRVVFSWLGIMPGYRELDISACFLVFFSLFFAMLIGDAGYGFLFLLGTIALRLRFRQAPPGPFRLFTLLSIGTIVWGVLSGTYFAISIPETSILRRLPSVAYLGDTSNVQRLCFLLGAIHLTIAHSWNAVIEYPRLRALGQLAWIPILWGNYFLAMQLVLNAPPVPCLKWLYISGIAGVILFSHPEGNLFRIVGRGMGTLAMGIVNSFVDVVSYVRLFAVGAATVKVAASFNEMAAATGSLPAPVAAMVAALILIFGHGLNILLGAMGVLVHGIRLNVLEFSSHIGLEFSGVPYRPLRRETPAAVLK